MPTTEIRRIQDQLRRAVMGGAWHGAALDEILADLSAEEASARPIPGAHTPWEIVRHIGAWLEAVNRRLEGEAVELEGDSDWPPVGEEGEAAWAAAKARVDAAVGVLQAAIGRMEDADLGRTVPGKEFDRYFMLHGVIQHTLYHAGQIVILKKALDEGAAG